MLTITVAYIKAKYKELPKAQFNQDTSVLERLRLVKEYTQTIVDAERKENAEKSDTAEYGSKPESPRCYKVSNKL